MGDFGEGQIVDLMGKGFLCRQSVGALNLCQDLAEMADNQQVCTCMGLGKRVKKRIYPIAKVMGQTFTTATTDASKG